jgi:hypothetical protein
VKKRIFIGLAITALSLPANPVRAGSLGDFFKALGNSIAHPGQKPKPSPSPNKHPKTKGSEPNAADYPPSPTATPSPQMATPTATLSPPQVRPASAPDRKSKRDIPYAIPVPNKPGFVTSPYSPKSGYVDVRGFPSGTEVKDPYSGKIFLTP